MKTFGGYDNKYHYSKFNVMLEEESFYNLKSKLARIEYFKGINRDAKVLEFGCGVGQNIFSFKNKYGIDLNKKLYPRLRSKGFIMYNSIKNLPNNFFDVILLCQVLEHLENPIKILKELKNKLRFNGEIRIILPILHPYPKVELNKSTDGHIYAWGFYEINYLLNLCGYKVIKNERIYRRGIQSLRGIARVFGFNFYYFLIKFLSRKSLDFDIMITAKKGER